MEYKSFCTRRHLDLDHLTLRRMARKRILAAGFSQKQATLILNSHPCDELISWEEKTGGWKLHPTLDSHLLVLTSLREGKLGA